MKVPQAKEAMTAGVHDGSEGTGVEAQLQSREQAAISLPLICLCEYYLLIKRGGKAN